MKYLKKRKNFFERNTFFRNWPYVNPFTHKLGYIGYLGYENRGDEIMFEAIGKLFGQVQVVPFKHNPKIKMFESFCAGKIFDGVLLGGGTLIFRPDFLKPVRNAINHYDQVFAFGSGVEDAYPNLEGKRKEELEKEWKNCLESFSSIGVRGPLSKEILISSGLKSVEVVGDPALLLADDRVQPKKKEKNLGINIGLTDHNLWGSEENVLDFAAEFSNHMIQKGWRITFIPFSSRDLGYIQEAVKRINHPVSIFGQYTSLNETMRFLRGCDIFIGEKLHSVILAVGAHTPSIMMEYRSKCYDFMASVGMEEFNVRTDQLSLDRMESLVNVLYQKIDEVQNKLAENTKKYKDRLNKFGHTILDRMRER